LSLSGPGEEALRGRAGEALDRLARWYLHRQGTFRPGEVIDRDRPYAEGLEAPGRAWPFDNELVHLGVPAEVAARAGRLAPLASVGELAEAARAAGRPLEVAVDAYPVLEDGLCLRPLLGALGRRPAPDRWNAGNCIHWPTISPRAGGRPWPRPSGGPFARRPGRRARMAGRKAAACPSRPAGTPGRGRRLAQPVADRPGVRRWGHRRSRLKPSRRTFGPIRWAGPIRKGA